MPKRSNITWLRQVRLTIIPVVDLLREEDYANRQTQTIGECLEYMLRTKVIEALCAYAMIDKPKGFFKMALAILTELFQTIKATSIISHSSVHPGINQLLRCIYRNIKDWKFNQKNEIDTEWCEEQVPNIYGSTHEVLEFILALSKKVSEEPYLVKVFFSQTANLDSDCSERICLPFQILVLYYKEQQKCLAQHDRGILRTVILKCINCMSKDQTFADYISSESDFIDIFMLSIAAQLEHLPAPLGYHKAEGFNLKHQLESNYNQMMIFQFSEFIDSLYFFKELLINIFKERGGSNSDEIIQQNPEQQSFEFKVKEAFQIAFIQIILFNIIQPALLQNEEPAQTRTIIQYLIEMLVVVNDKSIARATMGFLLNKLDVLKRQYEQLQLPHERASIVSDRVTDVMNYYVHGEQLSYTADEEHIVDYENNNKKKVTNSSLYSSMDSRSKKQSFDIGAIERQGEQKHPLMNSITAQDIGSGQKLMLPLTKMSEEDLSRRSKSGTNINSIATQRYEKSPQQIDHVTWLRMTRINSLFKEADDVADIKSVIDCGADHFQQKLEEVSQLYQGEPVCKATLTCLQDKNEGLSVCTIQTMVVLLQVLGLKSFYKDFILDDLKIISKQRNSNLKQSLGLVMSNLSLDDFEKVNYEVKLDQVNEIVDCILKNELDHMTKTENIFIECHSNLLNSLLAKTQTFFENEPSENIILIVRQFNQCLQDFWMNILDDSDLMLTNQDSMTLIIYLLQDEKGGLIQILESLNYKASVYEENQNIQTKLKTILQQGDEDAEDFITSYECQLKDQAENLLMFREFSTSVSRFIVHHYIAFGIVETYLTKKQEENDWINQERIKMFE